MNSLHPDQFNFLRELKENNNKPFFDAQKKRYEAIKQSQILFITDLIKLCTDFQPGLADLDPKKAIFRMNRDVRFSKDKSPYKTNMGAWMNEGGKNAINAGYYLHLEPDNVFIAGGIYMPEPPVLKAIRQEIDYNFTDFKEIVTNPTYKKYFKEMGGDKLKNNPKDYDKDNQAIEYLKHKDFLSSHSVDEKTALSKDFVKYCADVFSKMYPLNQFLNNAITELNSKEEDSPKIEI